MATRKRKAAEPKPKTTKRAKVTEDFELVDADKEFTLSIERCNR